MEGERRATSVEVGGAGRGLRDAGRMEGPRDGRQGRCSWREVGTGGGPGSSKVITGLGVGGRQATVSRPRGSLPGLGLAAPFCRLRRRVLPWGAQGRGTSSKCGHGLVRLDRGPYAVCPHSARLVCGGVWGGHGTTILFVPVSLGSWSQTAGRGCPVACAGTCLTARWGGDGRRKARCI